MSGCCQNTIGDGFLGKLTNLKKLIASNCHKKTVSENTNQNKSEDKENLI